MQNRTLRSQGLEVAAIGYGAMGLTMAYGPTDEEAGVAALRRPPPRPRPGVAFFDTAGMYGRGTGPVVEPAPAHPQAPPSSQASRPPGGSRPNRPRGPGAVGDLNVDGAGAQLS
ncbi:hypothetical protein QFZ63_001676 [Streptomyces sp. B3I7]|uniref:hypothetical protein n=1 Tax=Streptomyces sp. B3I7 TaxID=3042269 RepID=UPI00277FB2AD|nr:hypothetical protein [Streptomyces sp. B3I7]MDQ0809962.1 hypothetical protein [Streptomyces sp. B3I7]